MSKQEGLSFKGSWTNIRIPYKRASASVFRASSHKVNPRFTVIKLTRQNKPNKPGSLELSEIINTVYPWKHSLETGCGDIEQLLHYIENRIEWNETWQMGIQPNYPMLRLIRRSAWSLVSPSCGETWTILSQCDTGSRSRPLVSIRNKFYQKFK